MEDFKVRRIDNRLLRAECDRILGLVKRSVPFASVSEIGSTSVRGIIGKEDIDIIARVSPPRFAEARKLLDSLFSRNRRQLSDGQFQGYHVQSEFDVSVQLTIDGLRYEHFEGFAQMLRSDPDLRMAYNQLKADWDGRPMDEYRAAKSAFIARALESWPRRARAD